jgi:hypothetical protein
MLRFSLKASASARAVQRCGQERQRWCAIVMPLPEKTKSKAMVMMMMMMMMLMMTMQVYLTRRSSVADAFSEHERMD